MTKAMARISFKEEEVECEYHINEAHRIQVDSVIWRGMNITRQLLADEVLKLRTQILAKVWEINDKEIKAAWTELEYDQKTNPETLIECPAPTTVSHIFLAPHIIK